jgi:hypothetical protein
MPVLEVKRVLMVDLTTTQP